MWNDIAEPWKMAFLQGWEAFKNGSIPIGAAIIDETGNVISVGRNRLYEHSTLNPKIAHAETECLQKLDLKKCPNVKQYTLYACMEPCPMCFGTIVMSNFRKLKVAARDSYCGAVHYCEVHPYIKSKKMQVEFELGVLQAVQLTLQSYFELRACNGEVNRIVDIFCKDCPEAVKIAKSLYNEKYLDFCVQSNKEFKDVFDSILSRMYEYTL